MDLCSRVVIAVLRRLLPRSRRDEVLGDLLEDYEGRSHGRRRWLLGQACNLMAGLRLHAPGEVVGRSEAGDVWIGDLRYAWRSLRRARTSTAVAITSLGLGVGLTTTVYSVVDGVLLRPLPYHDSDRIVRVRQVAASNASVTDDVPRGLLGRWMAETELLRAMAVVGVEDTTVSFGGNPTAALAASVSSGYFDVLSTRALHGRLFTPEDAGPQSGTLAVLGHSYWHGVLGSDPAVVGRTIVVADQPFTVVGVAPPTFAYPSGSVAVYVLQRYVWPDPTLRQAYASYGPALTLLGRTRPGVDPADVEAEGTRVWGRLASAVGLEPTIVAPTFRVRRLQDELTEHVRPALLVLGAAVICVLVITCVNLANILLARGTVRQREMALRAALGASRWGMSRALAYESLLIGIGGGLCGLALAWSLVRWLPEFASLEPSVAQQIQIDGRVLAFVVTVSAIISLAFGALPAWQAPAARVKEALSASRVHLLPGASLKAEHLRGALVVIQVALAIVLVVSAALLARSLIGLLRVDLGFEPEQALTFQVRLPTGGERAYGWRVQFFNDLVAALAQRPGVVAAGFTTNLPMQDAYATTMVRVDGVAPTAGTDRQQAHREVVSPGYFSAVGMRVQSGRGFTATDTEQSERVVVVNDTFVKTFLPGRDPLGHRVMSFGREWHRIVGVVASKRHGGQNSDQRPEFYNALRQAPVDVVTGSASGFAVRGQGALGPLWPAVRAEVRRLLADAPLHHEAELSAQVWRESAQPRFYASVAGLFGALALVTSLVGLYGVLSFAVERRRVEIGVRRALGATPMQISNLVLGRGLRLVAIGVPIGALGAAASVGGLRTLLFGIEPFDVTTFVAVLIVVPVVALAACYLPARRATFIEPIDALREE